MATLDEKAINHEDLAAYHDQLMQSEMSKKSDKTNTYTKTEVDTKFDEFSGPVYDETDHFDLSCNVDSADLESVLPGTESERELMDIIQQHVQATGSEKGKRILENWNSERPKFVKIFPIDYRNALAKKA